MFIGSFLNGGDIIDKENLEAYMERRPNIPGNHPYKKSGAGLVPKTTSACIDCGVCALKCPVGAVNQKNPRIVNKEMCINYSVSF